MHIAVLTCLLFNIYFNSAVIAEFGREGPWKSFNNSCYLFNIDISKGVATWTKARESCLLLNSDWFQYIHNKKIILFYQWLPLIYQIIESVWIHTVSLFSWSDRTSANKNDSYINSIPGKSDTDDDDSLESCTVFFADTNRDSKNQGYWDNANCQGSHNYVCKRQTHFIPDVHIFGCDPDWREFNDKCFKCTSGRSLTTWTLEGIEEVFTDSGEVSFEKAKETCKSFRNTSITRSTLLTLRNDDDTNFMLTLTWGLGPLWLGIEFNEKYGLTWNDDLMALDSYRDWKDGSLGAPSFMITTPPNLGKWSEYSANNIGIHDPNFYTNYFACTQYKHYRKLPKLFNECVESNCPEMFETYGENCYWFEGQSQSHDEAALTCQRLSGDDFVVDLASILNPLDENFIRFQLRNAGSNEYWIGLRKLNGTIEWFDGWPFQFDSSVVESDSKIGGFCATVSHRNGQLVYTQRNCSEKLRPLCKSQRRNTRLSKDNSTCAFEPGCYSILTDQIDNYKDIITQIQDGCERWGTELAELNYAEMANFINIKDTWAFNANQQDCFQCLKPASRSKYPKHGSCSYRPLHQFFYIGVLKRSNESASDDTEEVEFYRWGIGEPKDNISLNEFDIFVLMDHYGYWHTVTSNDVFHEGRSKCYPTLCKSKLDMTTKTSTVQSTSTTSFSTTLGESSTHSAELPTKLPTTSTIVGTVFGVMLLLSIVIIVYKFRFDILNRLRSRYRMHIPEQLDSID